MKNLLPLQLAALAIAAVAPAFAQTNINSTATTAGDYSWTDTATWNAGTVPDSSGEQALLNPASGTPSGAINFTGLNGLTLAGITPNTAAPGSPLSVTYTVGTASDTITLTNSAGSNKGYIGTINNGGNLTVNANVSLDDANGVVLANNSFADNTNIAIINGNISGNSTVYKEGGRAVYLGGNNTYSGGVTFAAGLNRGYLIGSSTSAFINTLGTYTFATTGNFSSGIGAIATGTTVINNTIDLQNTNTAGSGVVSFRAGGTGSVFEVAGNIVNATGATGIQIQRSTGSNGGTLTGAGTVRFSGTDYTIAKNVTLFNNDDTTLDLAPNSGVQTWSGNFTGTAGQNGLVTKSGAGKAILSGANTHDRQTIVNAGTLLLNGTNQNATAFTFGYGYQQINPNVTGHWQVEGTGTLGGTGTIAGRTANNANVNNAIAVLVKSGGFLAPGDSTAASPIGTLTISTVDMANPGTQRGLVMASGAKFAMQLAGDGSAADVLALWGYNAAESTLTLNSNVIDLTLQGTPVAGTYERNIMTFFSDSGSTAVIHALVSGLILNIADPNITSATIDYTGLANDGTAVSVVYTVSGSGTTYASWATSNGISGEPADGDADDDGLKNALEMVVGGNPASQSDTDKLPVLALVTNPAGVPAGNYFEFTYRRSDVSVAAGVTAAFQYDTDLVAPWTTAVDGVNNVKIIETTDQYGTGIDRVQVYIPRASYTRVFGRLNVVVP